jgi:hypothetical protein
MRARQLPSAPFRFDRYPAAHLTLTQILSLNVYILGTSKGTFGADVNLAEYAAEDQYPFIRDLGLNSRFATH